MRYLDTIAKSLNSIEKLINTRPKLLLAVSAITLASLYLRLGDFVFIYNSLWAEDSTVFIKQAGEFGIESLWMPYAGYLHLYPRIIALIAEQLPVDLTPVIFFTSWLVSYFILFWVVIDRLITHDVSHLTIISIIALISIQPALGEVYFTITNAQWFLAAALLIYVLIPNRSATRSTTSNTTHYTFIAIACLTGPFCIFIIPGLIARFILFKDYRDNVHTYILFFLCTAIQLAVLLGSERLSSGELNPEIYNWIRAVKVFFIFGSSNTAIRLISYLFWILFFYSILATFKSKDAYRPAGFSSITILILTAFLCYAAGLYATRAPPHLISPISAGSRYFLIPYTLLIFSTAIIFSNNKRKLAFSLSLLIVIFTVLFQPIQRENLQYRAFIAFSKFLPELIVPINPVWAQYPMWHIKIINKLVNKPTTHDLDLSKLKAIGASLTYSDHLTIESYNNDPQLILSNVTPCKNSDSIGIDISMEKPNSSFTQIFWGNNLDFNEKRSLRIFYPSNVKSMHFAFENPGDPLFLRFDVLESPGSAVIHHIKLYCLHKTKLHP